MRESCCHRSPHATLLGSPASDNAVLRLASWAPPLPRVVCRQIPSRLETHGSAYLTPRLLDSSSRRAGLGLGTLGLCLGWSQCRRCGLDSGSSPRCCFFKARRAGTTAAPRRDGRARGLLLDVCRPLSSSSSTRFVHVDGFRRRLHSGDVGPTCALLLPRGWSSNSNSRGHDDISTVVASEEFMLLVDGPPIRGHPAVIAVLRAHP